MTPPRARPAGASRIRLRMLAVFAGLFLPNLASADTCASQLSCGACRNSSTFCHWCSDGQCHAVGSIHGCVYGTYCYDNDQCQRTEPEHMGYAPPSMVVLLGVLIVGGAVLMCGCGSMSLAKEYAEQSAADRRAAGDYWLTLAGDSPGASSSSEEEEEDHGVAAHRENGGAREGYGRGGPQDKDKRLSGGRNRASSSRAGVLAARAEHQRRLWRGGRRQRCGGCGGREADAMEPTPFASKVQSFTRLTCGCLMAVVFLVCTLAVFFAPHAPQVNVCNTQFDWGSIVNSLKKVSVEADFQLLVSVYNPNVMDVEVEGGSAVLSHKHQEVGQMAFDRFLVRGGYITDVLLTIQFDGQTWEDLHLGVEYETGTLSFLMDATVSASVMWNGWKTYPFTFSVTNYYIKVSDAVGYDRSLCNCPEMMQAAPHTAAHPRQGQPQPLAVARAAATPATLTKESHSTVRAAQDSLSDSHHAPEGVQAGDLPMGATAPVPADLSVAQAMTQTVTSKARAAEHGRRRRLGQWVSD